MKVVMKLTFNALNKFKKSESITMIFGRLYYVDELIKSDDMARSIFISSFVKPMLQQRGGDMLLTFCCEDVMKKVFDIMADDAPHILNITQSMQSALNLLIFVQQRYKEHELFRSYNF